MKMRLAIAMLAAGSAVFAQTLPPANAQSVPSKNIARKESDLPPFTYPMTVAAQALLDSDAATFNAFASKVRSDLESVIRDYDIQDKGVMLHLLSAKLDLQTLFGDDAEALNTCEQMRLLFDQPAMKATGMFNDVTFLKVRMTTGQSRGETFQAEYEKTFRSQVDSLPWAVVAERVMKRRADFERLSVEYVASKVAADIEPFVSEHHALDFHMATRLIFWRGVLLTELPQRQLVLNVLSAYIKERDTPRPPVALVRPVTDDYFGTKVVDDYRYMEDLKDADVQKWMKAQADYTRKTMDGLPGRAALLARIKDVMSLRPAAVSDAQIVARHFYTLRTPAGAQIAKLYVRDGLESADRLLIDPEKSPEPGGSHASISFYAPSPDNRYVAYGLLSGGSASAVLHVFDTVGGKDAGEIMDGARFAHPSWRDARSFYYTRLQRRQDKEFRAQSYLHVVGHDPSLDAAVLGFDMNPDILQQEEIPTVYTTPALGYVVAVIRRGVEQRRRVYAAPLAEATGPGAHWRPIAASYDDGILAWETRSAGALPAAGNTLYMISQREGPNGEIVSFDLRERGRSAPNTILASGKLPIEAIQVAKDGIYVQVMDGGVGRLERVGFNGKGPPTPVTLPFPASVLEVSTDPVAGGAVLSVVAWTRLRTFLRVESGAEQASDAGLQPSSALDTAADLEVREVMVKSWDGTEVPLSMVSKKGLALDGSHPTWLDGYGAYGYPATPGFFPGMRAAFERGVILARAHVRGGGDYGEAWHLAGYKLTKPNTWRDFIACAEYLVSHHYTNPSKLLGVGTSAGGILIGRAIEERPDLFAAAIATGPIADVLRWGATANGAGNEVEFGSIKTREGFEDLYAMSPYAHVRDGVKYPAVLVQTGISDDRVAPWLPAKFAARLQAATASGRPVLLRVAYDEGHGGIGATQRQEEERFADMISFALWQTGDPEFQPQ